MESVTQHLDAWRAAVRRRDRLELGSAEWQAADEDARDAALRFHGEVAQVAARYAELAFQDAHAASAHLDRRTSPAETPRDGR